MHLSVDCELWLQSEEAIYVLTLTNLVIQNILLCYSVPFLVLIYFKWVFNVFDVYCQDDIIRIKSHKFISLMYQLAARMCYKTDDEASEFNATLTQVSIILC